MKKRFNKGVSSLTIISIIIIILGGGVVAWRYLGTLKEGDGPLAGVPQECLQFQDDVCGLFDCMVDSCWCDGGTFPSPILFKGNMEILDEQSAIIVVNQYLKSDDSEYSTNEAVRLNSFFFNVFVYDVENNEEVFTVGADGTILKTICGI